MPIPGNLLSPTTEMVDPNISGWAAKLNATLVKGVGGRNGDGCLVVKSVAAGEVQARTVSSYPVAAGTTYYAFADASGSVPERIGIRWLSATGTEVSVSWSLTTLAASSGWHRVSVAAVAPVGAAQAQVLLSSTPAGAAVNHFWENVYLGQPIRTTGNLLPFTTESTEVDASGWTPVVNATISRQVPVISWSVTNYLAGGHALAMTAVAAGNASILAVDRPTVTPGEEYLAYAYLQPPTVASTAWIELRFYDSVGNQIQATRSVLAPPTPATGMYRQQVAATAPANAATCSIAAGLDGASAGQVLRLETVAILAAPELQSGSVLPYADSSFEQGIAGWTVASGVAALARTAPWGASGLAGSYALAVTSSTATQSVLRSVTMPVTEGRNWRAIAYAHPAAGTWSTVTVRVRWYDAADTDLGVSAGTTYLLPGSSWYGMQADQVAPAGAVRAAIEIVPTASSAGAVLHLDWIALWEVLPLTTVAADSGSGYVTLTLRELPPDSTLTVYRVGSDGARTLVRGEGGLIDGQAITVDLLVVEDHEAPLGRPVSYRIEIRDADGDLSTRGSDTVSLALDDINLAWLKDPGNPQRNLRVMVETAPNWQRPIEQSSHIVRGRRNKVIFSGRRQGLEGDLSVWTRSDEERESLHLLLDSGNTLLWQAAPGMGVDDMYVAVGQATEGRTSPLAQDEWRAWQLPLVQQDMPTTTGVNGAAGRTWRDVLTEFATVADVLDVYDTTEDLLLDRRG
ncbi:hypothetical protein GCM10010293_41050 [Streptomyces griseoflavus]|uniref:hypothetical protein n=1 Tax=Streptomyces griseoflavus TaxID=35619 RepID=UPI00167C45DB|nr:hypothetical protein [Streptomyces griseoflavus]GGV37295.1 hypothetical protein GCM10010293_41050 [Streptomyces griseoflavus]